MLPFPGIAEAALTTPAAIEPNVITYLLVAHQPFLILVAVLLLFYFFPKHLIT